MALLTPPPTLFFTHDSKHFEPKRATMTENKSNEIKDLVDTFLHDQAEAQATSEGRMTFENAVRAFIGSSSWIGPEHMPTVVGLLAIARKLDLEVTASMIGQYGVMFRDLRAQGPGGSKPSGDPLEDELKKAQL